MQQEVPFGLESRASARHYQRWRYDPVKPFLGRRILELGSGIGNLLQHLPLREQLILSDVNENPLEKLAKKLPRRPELSVVRVDTDKPLRERFAAENV